MGNQCSSRTNDDSTRMPSSRHDNKSSRHVKLATGNGNNQGQHIFSASTSQQKESKKRREDSSWDDTIAATSATTDATNATTGRTHREQEVNNSLRKKDERILVVANAVHVAGAPAPSTSPRGSEEEEEEISHRQRAAHYLTRSSATRIAADISEKDKVGNEDKNDHTVLQVSGGEGRNENSVEKKMLTRRKVKRGHRSMAVATTTTFRSLLLEEGEGGSKKPIPSYLNSVLGEGNNGTDSQSKNCPQIGMSQEDEKYRSAERDWEKLEGPQQALSRPPPSATVQLQHDHKHKHQQYQYQCPSKSLFHDLAKIFDAPLLDLTHGKDIALYASYNEFIRAENESIKSVGGGVEEEEEEEEEKGHQQLPTPSSPFQKNDKQKTSPAAACFLSPTESTSCSTSASGCSSPSTVSSMPSANAVGYKIKRRVIAPHPDLGRHFEKRGRLTVVTKMPKIHFAPTTTCASSIPKTPATGGRNQDIADDDISARKEIKIEKVGKKKEEKKLSSTPPPSTQDAPIPCVSSSTSTNKKSCPAQTPESSTFSLSPPPQAKQEQQPINLQHLPILQQEQQQNANSNNNTYSIPLINSKASPLSPYAIIIPPDWGQPYVGPSSDDDKDYEYASSDDEAEGDTRDRQQDDNLFKRNDGEGDKKTRIGREKNGCESTNGISDSAIPNYNNNNNNNNNNNKNDNKNDPKHFKVASPLPALTISNATTVVDGAAGRFAKSVSGVGGKLKEENKERKERKTILHSCKQGDLSSLPLVLDVDASSLLPQPLEATIGDVPSHCDTSTSQRSGGTASPLLLTVGRERTKKKGCMSSKRLLSSLSGGGLLLLDGSTNRGNGSSNNNKNENKDEISKVVSTNGSVLLSQRRGSCSRGRILITSSSSPSSPPPPLLIAEAHRAHLLTTTPRLECSRVLRRCDGGKKAAKEKRFEEARRLRLEERRRKKMNKKEKKSLQNKKRREERGRGVEKHSEEELSFLQSSRREFSISSSSPFSSSSTTWSNIIDNKHSRSRSGGGGFGSSDSSSSFPSFFSSRDSDGDREGHEKGRKELVLLQESFCSTASRLMLGGGPQCAIQQQQQWHASKEDNNVITGGTATDNVDDDNARPFYSPPHPTQPPPPHASHYMYGRGSASLLRRRSLALSFTISAAEGNGKSGSGGKLNNNKNNGKLGRSPSTRFRISHTHDGDDHVGSTQAPPLLALPTRASSCEDIPMTFSIKLNNGQHFSEDEKEDAGASRENKQKQERKPVKAVETHEAKEAARTIGGRHGSNSKIIKRNDSYNRQIKTFSFSSDPCLSTSAGAGAGSASCHDNIMICKSVCSDHKPRHRKKKEQQQQQHPNAVVWLDNATACKNRLIMSSSSSSRTEATTTAAAGGTGSIAFISAPSLSSSSKSFTTTSSAMLGSNSISRKLMSPTLYLFPAKGGRGGGGGGVGVGVGVGGTNHQEEGKHYHPAHQYQQQWQRSKKNDDNHDDDDHEDDKAAKNLSSPQHTPSAHVNLVVSDMLFLGRPRSRALSQSRSAKQGLQLNTSNGCYDTDTDHTCIDGDGRGHTDDKGEKGCLRLKSTSTGTSSHTPDVAGPPVAGSHLYRQHPLLALAATSCSANEVESFRLSPSHTPFPEDESTMCQLSSRTDEFMCQQRQHSSSVGRKKGEKTDDDHYEPHAVVKSANKTRNASGINVSFCLSSPLILCSRGRSTSAAALPFPPPLPSNFTSTLDDTDTTDYNSNHNTGDNNNNNGGENDDDKQRARGYKKKPNHPYHPNQIGRSMSATLGSLSFLSPSLSPSSSLYSLKKESLPLSFEDTEYERNEQQQQQQEEEEEREENVTCASNMGRGRVGAEDRDELTHEASVCEGKEDYCCYRFLTHNLPSRKTNEKISLEVKDEQKVKVGENERVFLNIAAPRNEDAFGATPQRNVSI